MSSGAVSMATSKNTLQERSYYKVGLNKFEKYEQLIVYNLFN